MWTFGILYSGWSKFMETFHRQTTISVNCCTLDSRTETGSYPYHSQWESGVKQLSKIVSSHLYTSGKQEVVYTSLKKWVCSLHSIFFNEDISLLEGEMEFKLAEGYPHPYLFGIVEIFELPALWCTCSDLFLCRWQDEDRRESTAVSAMIRPDQSCRVWCSLCRCHTSQTVRCPDPVWRSSRRHTERLEVESDSKLLLCFFFSSFWTAPPITSEFVYTVYYM